MPTNEEAKAAEIDAMIKAKKDAEGEGDARHAALMDKLDKMCSRMDEMERCYGSKKDAESIVGKTVQGAVGGTPHEGIEHGDPDDGADVDPKTGKPVRSPNNSRTDAIGYHAVASANRDAIAHFRSRADRVYSAMSQTSPRPFGDGEGFGAYRRRVLNELKRYSDSYKDVSLNSIRDAGAFKAAENHIFADAMQFVAKPSNLATDPEEFYPVETVSPGGHRITQFYSHPNAQLGCRTIFGQMKSDPLRIVGFLTPPRG